MPKVNWDDLLKSTPRFLVLAGLVLIVLASLASFKGMQFQLGSTLRDVIVALGAVLIIAGAIALLVGVRAEKPPISSIKIDKVDTTGAAPRPKVDVSGHVTPKKEGVNVYIVRRSLAGREVMYSLAPGFAATNANGDWKHPVALWTPGPFEIYAVVTTKAYEELFGFYRRVFEAMLAETKKTDPDANSVPGWPNLAELPKISVIDRYDYQLPR